jgi:outer membrane lipoprotein-sorting protein
VTVRPTPRPHRRAAAALAALAALAAGLAARAPSGAAAVEPSLAARAARFAPVASAVAAFAQEREVSLVEEVLHARGTLALGAPDRLRLELEAPEPLTLVAAGDRVAVLDAAGAPLPLPPEVAGLGRFAHELTALLLGGAPGRFGERWRGPDAVTLVARDAASPYAEIALRFPPDGPLPEEIVLRERGGDRTTIRLRAIRLNPPLEAGLFAVPAAAGGGAAAGDGRDPARDAGGAARAGESAGRGAP